MPYTPELKFCPGCRAACSIDKPTCKVGAMFKAQYERDHPKKEQQKAPAGTDETETPAR